MLSDIFPTGYHGAAVAGVVPGDTVAVFGAGPVGLLAAHSAYLRAAARVFVAEQILDATGGTGADRGIEAVGYERLRDLIIAGRATPSLLVSHELSLDEAPAAYDRFDKRADGYTKVLLHPSA